MNCQMILEKAFALCEGKKPTYPGGNRYKIAGEEISPKLKNLSYMIEKEDIPCLSSLFIEGGWGDYIWLPIRN